MHFNILTLFPQMFDGPLDFSIIKRAKEKELVTIDIINIRDYSTDKYHSVDDHPYGGGAGMILRVDVLDAALTSLKNKGKTILLDPGGAPYTQTKARELSDQDTITLVCGHYEGIDERVRSLVDESISIGDYVLTGGELPAMVIIDSLVRLIPGVLAKPEATEEESFSQNNLEYPQYTRPENYKGTKVPKTLVSGDHKKIIDWRNKKSEERTKKLRPDLRATAKKDLL